MAKSKKTTAAKGKEKKAPIVMNPNQVETILEKVTDPTVTPVAVKPVRKSAASKITSANKAAVKPAPIPPASPITPTSGKFENAVAPEVPVNPIAPATAKSPAKKLSLPKAKTTKAKKETPVKSTGESAPVSKEVVAAPSIPAEQPAPKPAKATRLKVATPKNGAGDKLRILFVTAECVPYAKTGGLGDAVAGLSKALQRLGHDVRIVMPLYAMVDYTKHGLKFHGSACVHMGHGEENWVGIHTARLDNEVEVWFVDYGRFFHRPGIYADGGGDYSDNAYRFGLLSKAAMQFCKDLKFIPHVMHLHDWQAAPTAAFLKTWDKFASPLSDTASVLTIHNIGHQGKYHSGVMGYYGLGNEHFNADKFEDFGGVNLLKAGIHFADAITTVSPTHAREILEPIGGQGLERQLGGRGADVSGILNGVDYEHWSPETDSFLPAKYSASNIKGKAVCKEALQKRFGLEVRPDVPLFGIVSRFAQQKGLDLLTGALPRALNGMAMQLVVLGTGDRNAEDFFNWLHAIYPQRVGVYIGFSNELSHLVEAGSDFFIMPSLYEPCGLNQIYSLAYGTLPVVRATGGLADTVENYNQATGEGTGFVFNLPTAQALYDTIGWAVSTWYDRPQHFKKLQQSAMHKQFKWETSAQQYVDVYKRAIARRAAS